jgi:hypothetical protein
MLNYAQQIEKRNGKDTMTCEPTGWWITKLSQSTVVENNGQIVSRRDNQYHSDSNKVLSRGPNQVDLVICGYCGILYGLNENPEFRDKPATDMEYVKKFPMGICSDGQSWLHKALAGKPKSAALFPECHLRYDEPYQGILRRVFPGIGFTFLTMPYIDSNADDYPELVGQMLVEAKILTIKTKY